MGERRRARERREPVFDVGPDPGSRPGPAPEPVEVSPDAASRRTRTGGGAGGGERPPRKRRRKSGGRSGPRRVLYWGAVVALWLVIAAIGAGAWAIARLPPIQSLEIPKRPPTIQIVDRKQQPLATRGDFGGAAVSLKELPRYVPQAFVAIEDRRFYSHSGLDPIGMARALVANVLRRGVSQGGSTITQQLAKNLFLTQERTLTRKVQEAMLALWLERKFSKTEILELYLNRVYFGAGAYGIEAAAQRYFSKPAQQADARRRPPCSPASSARRRGSRRAATPTAPSAARRPCSPPWST